jgi:mono/diheme cytochrome c family protein
LVGLVVVGWVGIQGVSRYATRNFQLPPQDQLDSIVALDQGWSGADAQWYWHASQGGSFELPMPYEWLVNLERPEVAPTIFSEVGLLFAPDYISRFGFLTNPDTSYDYDSLTLHWAEEPGLSTLSLYEENNPDALPIGFTRFEDWVDERTQETVDVMGFSCAACHTGQLNYDGTGIRIEGGPALTDLGKFREAVGVALAMTYYIPTRRARFIERVHGPDATDEQVAELERKMKALISRGKALADYEAANGIYPVVEGFGRLDAVGRIGNFVFGEEITWENLVPADAPVNFPHIWDTPWFDWVQYNASFSQPMMRNAGESMGVFASVNMGDTTYFGSGEEVDTILPFQSTINVVNLHEMESLIRGQAPYEGLRSPEWPEDILPALRHDRVELGAELYRDNCQECHMPPMTDGDAFLADEYWTDPADSPVGRRYLKMNIVNLGMVGTDPKTALNFATRAVDLGTIGWRYADSLNAMQATPTKGAASVSAGVALPFLIEVSKNRRYDELGLDQDQRARFDGYRPPVIQAPFGYKARPLNGVWATPPFLHNGSVPTIYHLLGPEEERPDTFWLGTKEYDPEWVGYEWGPVENGFLLDTSIPGNWNAGHRFCGDREESSSDWWGRGCLPAGDTIGVKSTLGVIGPALSPEDRLNIIEFLKSLPSVPMTRESGAAAAAADDGDGDV